MYVPPVYIPNSYCLPKKNVQEMQGSDVLSYRPNPQLILGAWKADPLKSYRFPFSKTTSTSDTNLPDTHAAIASNMESSQDFQALRDAIQPALVTVTRSANSLANEDLPFQRTVHASVDRELDDATSRMLRIASDLLKSAGKVTGQKTHALEDADDVDIRWRSIVDVIDTLLEKADTCLDEYTGLIKRKDAPAADPVGFDVLRPPTHFC